MAPWTSEVAMEFVHVEAKATLTSHPHSTRLVQSPRHIQLLLQWRLITSGMPYPAVHLLTSYLGHRARLFALRPRHHRLELLVSLTRSSYFDNGRDGVPSCDYEREDRDE